MPEIIFNGPAGRLEGRYQPSSEKNVPKSDVGQSVVYPFGFLPVSGVLDASESLHHVVVTRVPSVCRRLVAGEHQIARAFEPVRRVVGAAKGSAFVRSPTSAPRRWGSVQASQRRQEK